MDRLVREERTRTHADVSASAHPSDAGDLSDIADVRDIGRPMPHSEIDRVPAPAYVPYDHDQLSSPMAAGEATMRSRSKQAAWGTVGLCLFLIGGVGCSSSKPRADSSNAPSGHGAVTGTLHLTGGDPGTDKAASGVVYAFTSSSLSGTPIANVKAGSDGTFHLSLSPGTYYLAATSPSFSIDPPPAAPPCRGDAPAVVSNGSTSKVEVVCAMK
jgi:hypothetical protein